MNKSKYKIPEKILKWIQVPLNPNKKKQYPMKDMRIGIMTGEGINFIEKENSKMGPESNIRGKIFIGTKDSLLRSYKTFRKDNYLRRFAESIASEMCEKNESLKIPGDLAKRIDTKLIQKGEEPLNEKEIFHSKYSRNKENLF